MNIELPSYPTVETNKPEVQFETIEFTSTTHPEINDGKSSFPHFTLLGFFNGSFELCNTKLLSRKSIIANYAKSSSGLNIS